METETTMFDRIINKIAERSERLQTLDTNFQGFAIGVKEALGDAAPEGAEYTTDALIAGVHSLRAQADEGKDYGIRIDELHAEKQLIAEALGLLKEETENGEPDGDE